MIDNQIARFPIIYANSMGLGKIAIGSGSHTTVGDECKAAGIKKALIVTTGLKGTGIVEEIETACENIVWASSMSGALGLSCGGGTGIVHGIGHGLSVLKGVHHGLASAVVTLPGERYNQAVCPDRFAEMAEAIHSDRKFE